MVIGMKVRATNTRLADMSKNTVQSQRRLRIDRHGRDRPCAEALEREVEDGHPTYKVQVHALIEFRPSTPKQGVRGLSGRGRNRSVRTLKRCPDRSAELFERYILVILTVTY